MLSYHFALEANPMTFTGFCRTANFVKIYQFDNKLISNYIEFILMCLKFPAITV